jgi:NADH:ubiquinone oxidoreductase subunit 4 (subunit M)
MGRGAATGVILSACYMLWMYQRVAFGPVTHEENKTLIDLSLRERLVFAPLLLLISGWAWHRSHSWTGCSPRSTAPSR